MPFEFCEGAYVAIEDLNHGYIMAWFGGHGIHAYDLTGTKVAFWNVGDFGRRNARAEEVQESMEEHAKSGEYLEYIDR